jgi:molybdopterin-guanine dinucleotide biosynthesis protein A
VADFEAFVLTGGQSERMGRDKALVEIDGVPMVRRVTDELEQAGAARVRCVGGDAAALTALGLDALDDEHPGAGPLAGLLVALRASILHITLVAPCDLIEPRREGFAELVAALDGSARARAAVPLVEGTWRPLPCALRSTAFTPLDDAFAAGERAVHRGLAGLERVEVEAGSFRDADTPGDLPGHQ